MVVSSLSILLLPCSTRSNQRSIRIPPRRRSNSTVSQDRLPGIHAHHRLRDVAVAAAGRLPVEVLAGTASEEVLVGNHCRMLVCDSRSSQSRDVLCWLRLLWVSAAVSTAVLWLATAVVSLIRHLLMVWCFL